MKEREIVVGQTYLLNGYPITIQYSDFSDFAWLCDELQPIPLTEEWLIKFGFRLSGKWYYNKRIELNISLYYKNATYGSNEEYTINYPSYVHQLQNLIFALRGEEL